MSRSGQFVKQVEGYRAFLPAPLLPSPPLVYDADLIRLLSDADQRLARLDGVTSTLPNTELFVAMYVRQEAVLSSQIEGTQSTLEDVLQFEIDPQGEALPRDVGEVVNYVAAMNHGLQRLPRLPLSLRLIKEIHGVLLQGTRGGEKTPGQFRVSQNWIGPAGCTLATASFVPPPVAAMKDALGDLEKFLHDTSLPILIQCGLAHAQFETIHPFLDGNGRVGRLLITLLLCSRAVLQRPLLYLSYFLKQNRLEYYDRLTAIRQQGDWEGWLKFFLRGVAEVSREATDAAHRILALREQHLRLIRDHARISSTYGLQLLDYLYEQPITTARLVKDRLNSSYSTANKVLNQFVELALLHEMTGFGRNRRFAYAPYLDVFARTEQAPEDVLRSTTSIKPDQESLVYSSETDGLGDWVYFCNPDNAGSITTFSASDDTRGFVLTAFGSESVGVNKSLRTLFGRVEFEYQVIYSELGGKNMCFCVVPIQETGFGRGGVIEVGGPMQGDPQNANSPHRARMFLPPEHAGKKEWQPAQLDFDFRNLPEAFYSIFAPRINEDCTARGIGQLRIRRVRVYAYRW